MMLRLKIGIIVGFAFRLCFNENAFADSNNNNNNNNRHELIFAPDPELPIYPVVYGLRVEGEPEDVIGYS